MGQVETSIDIKAPAEIVRQVLNNFKEYQNWNPYMLKIEQTQDPKKILVTQKTPKDTFVFNPTITEQSDSKLSWEGYFCCWCILNARHQFSFIQEEGVTKFNSNQYYGGCLFPCFACCGLFDIDWLTNEFNEVNLKFKAICQSRKN